MKKNIRTIVLVIFSIINWIPVVYSRLMQSTPDVEVYIYIMKIFFVTYFISGITILISILFIYDKKISAKTGSGIIGLNFIYLIWGAGCMVII